MQALVGAQAELVLVMESQTFKKASMAPSEPQVSMACVICGAESLNNVTCQYCWKSFCELHWLHHVSWEKGHEGFAEEYARMWKKSKAEP